MVNRFLVFLVFFLVISSTERFQLEENVDSLEHREEIVQETKLEVKKKSKEKTYEDERTPMVNQEEPTMKTSDEEAYVLPETDLFIVGLGDSLTLGVGDASGQGYIGIVKKRLEEGSGLRVALKNFGKKGQRSDQLLKSLKKEEVRHSLQHANLIFISIGGNDVMNVFKKHFFNLNMKLFEEQNIEFLNNLREVLQRIREINPSASIYMIGLFNPFFPFFAEIAEIEEVIQSWNEGSLSVASNFNDVHFVPIDTIFKNKQMTVLYEDYFHPNHEGYRLIAEKVLISMAFEDDFRFQ